MPKFCVGPHVTPENDQNFKKMCLKVFLYVQREDAHRYKLQIKVEIEDGCEAPYKPSNV